MWFKNLTGFSEKNPEYVRENLTVQDNYLISKANDEKLCFGRLEIPTLVQLRSTINLADFPEKKTSIKEVVGNVQHLHLDPANKNALFQAASQFNLLEMVNPNITPEQGIDRYENDRTQGPSCAIACGAGTIYRNYFVPINNQLGQTKNNQIDCLEEIGKELKNEERQLWSMENGYAMANQEGLTFINKHLASLNQEQTEALKGKLKIGIQWNTAVTISPKKHLVTQVYCAALPVTYSEVPVPYWENFASLILEATYEATLYVALKNMKENNCNLVYLTLIGGGVFGNEQKWIFDALEKAVLKFKNTGLDIRIVSYSGTNLKLERFIRRIKRL